MSTDETRLAKTAQSIREAFDQSFARIAAPPQHRPANFLAVVAGGDPYAIRLDDVSALHQGRKVVRLPNRAPELLGIAGFRGTMAPVYDLGALLGYPPAPRAAWLVIARGTSPVGLAFERFEAHLRVAEEDVSREEVEKGARQHVRGAVRAGQILRPLIHFPSLIEAIARRVHVDGLQKDR